jgi:hypothetical protein
VIERIEEEERERRWSYSTRKLQYPRVLFMRERNGG